MGLCNGTSSRQKNNQTPINKRFAQVNIRQFYRFGKVLGSGSFGTVRLAYNILEEKNGQVSKAFAVKSISKETLGDHFYMILRELDILTQLDHPNIIRFYETYEDERYYHFVMEYCGGGELFERILKKGLFAEGQAAKIMFRLFSAMEYVHNQGVAHRDLKPENLLLSSEDTYEVKIIDFGLSKKYQNESKNKQNQVGTPLYVAPEVLDGKFSLECDNWSLGCIMYVLLCGTTPFYSQDKTMLAAMIRHSPVKFEEPEWDKVSEEAKSMIKGLLTKDPKKRTTCKQALQSPWFKKFKLTPANALTRQQTMSAQDGLQTFKLLNSYANASRFKKETLKILLNQLKESEIKALRQKFESLDEDGNGVITPDELKQVLGDMGMKGTSEIEQLIKKVSGNTNQKQLHIKYSEFLAATLNSKQYLNKQRLWCLFKKFDINNKGYIAMDDLRHILQREGKACADNKLKEIFLEIDEKKFGKLDFQDFLLVMQKDIQVEDILDDSEDQLGENKEPEAN